MTYFITLILFVITVVLLSLFCMLNKRAEHGSLFPKNTKLSEKDITNLRVEVDQDALDRIRSELESRTS